MNAAEMTFGIEIECFLPVQIMDNVGIVVGYYHQGQQIPNLPAGWKAQSDGSLHSSKRGYCAVEISSPVLRGREGIEQVIAVVNQLRAWRFYTNPTCGLHVHVGADFSRNARALKNLIFLSAKFERALFAVTGTKRREHGNYSAPMSEAYQQVKNMTAVGDVRPVAQKYRSLNLCHLFSAYQTVEFRVFQGTTNLNKILGYIQICLGLCEQAHAMKRTPTYQCKNYRHQTGRGLVYRMLRNFGWYAEKKMGETKYGVLTPERIETLKGELSRLAAKYDADELRQHRALQPVVEPRRGPVRETSAE